MLNIGVVGCGTVSRHGHLPVIVASKRWRLTGAVDTNKTVLAEVERDFHPSHAFTDYHDLLELADLDAVVVATHLGGHHEITMAALSKGLHVLCEKPMAASAEQCRQMVDAAKQSGRILAVNFNTRSGVIYREIKRLIDDGAVGAVRVVRFVLNWSAHQWQPPERLDKFMEGGGPIIDSGVHFFEAARWFTGQDFARISAEGVFLPPYDNPQHAVATCRMTGGAVALVEAGWLYCKSTKDDGSVFRIDVIGDDGAISYDRFSATLRIFTKTESREQRLEDAGKHFEVVYDSLAESIDKGEMVDLASGYDGLKATEAAFEALKSAKRGRTP